MRSEETEKYFNNAAPTGPDPVFTEARNTLKQVNAVAYRILDLADRLLGPGKAEANAIAQAQPSGDLGRFRAEMRDTRQAMIFADDALTRIEQELIG
jgi:hypothetical protein